MRFLASPDNMIYVSTTPTITKYNKIKIKSVNVNVLSTLEYNKLKNTTLRGCFFKLNTTYSIVRNVAVNMKSPLKGHYKITYSSVQFLDHKEEEIVEVKLGDIQSVLLNKFLNVHKDSTILEFLKENLIDYISEDEIGRVRTFVMNRCT